jgi:hypothetical protein
MIIRNQVVDHERRSKEIWVKNRKLRSRNCWDQGEKRKQKKNADQAPRDVSGIANLTSYLGHICWICFEKSKRGWDEGGRGNICRIRFFSSLSLILQGRHTVLFALSSYYCWVEFCVCFGGWIVFLSICQLSELCSLRAPTPQPDEARWAAPECTTVPGSWIA